VAIEKNEDSTGGFFFGQMVPEYHEGDQVEAGRRVGQVIDPKEMEVAAKVGELERNSIKVGQAADVRLEALPGSVFHGTVKTLGGMNNRMFWEPDTGARFEVTVALTDKDTRLRPGLTAHITIHGDARKDVLYVPRQALFLKDSKRIVFTRKGSGFDPHEVKIQAENESRAAIEGLSAGTEVALIDPTATRKSAPSAASTPSAGGAP
jgi:HlyD family secretion protein